MIKILKSGSWALEGVNVVEMIAGTQCNFGPSENCKLVDAGWAEWEKKAHPGEIEVSVETDDTSALADRVVKASADAPRRKAK